MRGMCTTGLRPFSHSLHTFSPLSLLPSLLPHFHLQEHPENVKVNCRTQHTSLVQYTWFNSTVIISLCNGYIAYIALYIYNTTRFWEMPWLCLIMVYVWAFMIILGKVIILCMSGILSFVAFGLRGIYKLVYIANASNVTSGLHVKKGWIWSKNYMWVKYIYYKEDIMYCCNRLCIIHTLSRWILQV